MDRRRVRRVGGIESRVHRIAEREGDPQRVRLVVVALARRLTVAAARVRLVRLDERVPGEQLERRQRVGLRRAVEPVRDARRICRVLRRVPHRAVAGAVPLGAVTVLVALQVSRQVDGVAEAPEAVARVERFRQPQLADLVQVLRAGRSAVADCHVRVLAFPALPHQLGGVHGDGRVERVEELARPVAHVRRDFRRPVAPHAHVDRPRDRHVRLDPPWVRVRESLHDQVRHARSRRRVFRAAVLRGLDLEQRPLVEHPSRRHGRARLRLELEDVRAPAVLDDVAEALVQRKRDADLLKVPVTEVDLLRRIHAVAAVAALVDARVPGVVRALRRRVHQARFLAEAAADGGKDRAHHSSGQDP